ncbi:IS3 family transposase [Streptomyces sp. NPDC002785]|uniref:IS3 family transposase n=1 Tax=Streptomyces sp. NPDC002785 TaxID=3154543 RepID=UPI00332F4B1A
MAKQYPKQLKERAVRLILETRDQYKTESAAIRSIGAKLDVGPESLRNRVRQAEVDADARTGTTTEESTYGCSIHPSTYYAHKKRMPSARSPRDAELAPLITSIYRDNYSAYGARKTWAELKRQGHQVTPVHCRALDEGRRHHASRARQEEPGERDTDRHPRPSFRPFP